MSLRQRIVRWLDPTPTIPAADVDAVEALWELSCCCGVITADDSARWNDAQTRVPALVARLRSETGP